MKICWDNLEGLYLTKNGTFRKGTVIYVEKDACNVCGEMYLEDKRKDRVGGRCSLECVYRCEDYKKLKSKIQKGKPSGMKGRKTSEKTKKLISIANTGKKRSEEMKKRVSEVNTGLKRSLKTRMRISNGLKGRVISEETRIKMRKNHADFSLDKHPGWKGGISCEPYCFEWSSKEFKDMIKDRDENRCLNPDCWKSSYRLSAHHIDYNKKNCEPENLITLCVSCNSRANSEREWHKFWYTAIMERRVSNGTYNQFSL